MAQRNQDRAHRQATTPAEQSERDHGSTDSSRQPHDDVHGEGNYKAAREFDKAEREFVQSGKLEEGIRNAAPKSEAERHEIEAAEQQARRRAKEEDPALGGKPQKDRQRKR